MIDSLGPSGAERSTLALVEPLRSRGIDVEIAHFGSTDQPEAEGNVPVILHRMTGAGRTARTRAVRRVVRAVGPDLVHTTLFESDLAGRAAARSLGVPVVSSLVNMAYGPEQRAALDVSPWKLRAAQLADAATARGCVRIHAISHAVAEVMGRRLRLDRQRIDVVPRGRNEGELGRRTPERRAAARARLGLDDDTFAVLAVGRQEPQKGLDVLLRATPQVAKRVPTMEVLLAGRPGSDTGRLRGIAASVPPGPEVRMLGRRDDVADLMAAADVFVFPSRWEGFGGVLVEALALEVPIVATGIPTSREILRDDEGRLADLVPTDSPEALADAVVAVHDAPEQMWARTVRGRRHFETQYTVDAVADGMAAFYRRSTGRT